MNKSKLKMNHYNTSLDNDLSNEIITKNAFDRVASNLTHNKIEISNNNTTDIGFNKTDNDYNQNINPVNNKITDKFNSLSLNIDSNIEQVIAKENRVVQGKEKDQTEQKNKPIKNNISNKKTSKNDNNRVIWDSQRIDQLKKLLIKYPSGSSNKWNIIAKELDMDVLEVINFSKTLSKCNAY